ncbi:MAG: hypothetical protein JO129_03705 [Candidatus Dependentiae bacterium]|nr:hypothetical protein [Candidatus Dependentiae bacterium]
MKKNLLSLRSLLFLSIVMGSTFVMEATPNSNKSSVSVNKKSSIKSIERNLSKIKRDFQRDNDAKAANKKLDKIAKEIKQAIAELKRSENHMWKVHERTLNKKLSEVRKYVKEHSNK